MSKPNADYVRLLLKDHAGKSEYLSLRILGEDATWLRGYKVDRYGTETECWFEKDVLHTSERLIDKQAIIRRTPLVMSRHYGDLRPAPKGTQIDSSESEES